MYYIARAVTLGKLHCTALDTALHCTDPVLHFTDHCTALHGNIEQHAGVSVSSRTRADNNVAILKSVA